MDEKSAYGGEDCVQTGTGMFISGYVIVLKPEALPQDQHGIRQLLFCEGGLGSGPDEPDGSSVRAVSLANGECVRRKRSEILGLLKTELLPDRARLQLSQIRPLDSEVPKAPQFFGYCFLPDGRYAAGVPLSDEMEVREYIDTQRGYQHRVMICDSEDSCVFEMTAGKVTFPTREDIERFNKEQTPPDAPESGGMEMKP